MRILGWCLAMIVAGAVVGGILSRAEFAGVREDFEPQGGSSQRAKEANVTQVMRAKGAGLSPSQGVVVEVVNGEVHDFGTLEVGGKGSHDFVIRNSGTAVLQLESGGTSCQACTISRLEDKEIEPGAESRVTINWTVATEDLEFRKEAYLLTNDPRRPTVVLTIRGKPIKSIRVEDEEIRLGAVSISDGGAGSCRIYGFREEKLEILATALKNPESEKYFTVAVRPLTSDELVKREGALQGFEVTATAKSGLPLGAILQTIQLETNWEGTKKIEIPIRGDVVSGLSVIGGRDFDPQKNIFRVGVVPRGEGRKIQAQISIKGAERNDVKLEVGDIEPAGALRAVLGEPKAINNGAVLLVPLTIEIPVGAPQVSRMGGTERKDFGRIVIKTTHSTSKELELLIRFAVE